MVSVSIANGSGSWAVAIIDRPSGLPLSALFTGSASRDSDTVTPSLTVARARFRVSSVIRLTVPRSSSLPQRFQFESSVIQRSIVPASSGPASADADAAGRGACAMARLPPATAAVTAMAKTEIGRRWGIESGLEEDDVDFAGPVHAAAERVLDVGGAARAGDRDQVAARRDEIAARREQRRNRVDEAV